MRECVRRHTDKKYHVVSIIETTRLFAPVVLTRSLLSVVIWVQAMRMEKMQGGKLKMGSFEKWKRTTHFISRRITFDKGSHKKGLADNDVTAHGIYAFSGSRINTGVRGEHLQQVGQSL